MANHFCPSLDCATNGHRNFPHYYCAPSEQIITAEWIRENIGQNTRRLREIHRFMNLDYLFDARD